MKPKKNAFSYFVISLFLVGDLYILISGISALGKGQEYPFVLQGLLVLLFGLMWLALNFIAALLCRLTVEDLVKKNEKLFQILEYLFVAAVLLVGIIIREKFIANFPMNPHSDYKTYYEVADLINRGMLRTEGTGYCDYISVFPHVYGYPYILSKLFKVFGTSVNVALQFNVILSVITAFLVYLAAKLSFSRGTALIALCLTTFWPSQIMYINMVASEYLFSALFLACLTLFIYTIKKYDVYTKRPVIGVLLHLLLGMLLAVCATVRPMALILLITIILCIGLSSFRLPVRKVIDQPISLVILSKGWMRCLLIIIPYILLSNLFTFGITLAIGREPAGGSSSMGYNLLVGLNTESYGGWNQEDADYLYDALDRNPDALKAQQECLDLAVQRFKKGPEPILNLFVHKYQVLWSNDDYSATWNLELLKEQGNLTPEREQFLYKMQDINNFYYLMVVALAGISAIFLWKNEMSYSYVYIMIFIGTVAMHLFVENQNRYHYHALFMLALIASEAFSEIYKLNRARVLAARVERENLIRIKQEEAQKRRSIQEEEENLRQLRIEAMQSQFDMKSALEQNLIKVSVSDSYRRINGLEFEDIAEKKDENKDRKQKK